jgi:PPK2 family polyphosphate:nucleotide phosphotransferase
MMSGPSVVGQIKERKSGSMEIDIKEFRAKPQEKIKLKEWPTKQKPLFSTKEEYQQLMAKQVSQLSTLQGLLYASSQYSVLVIFQAMDAAGKDSAIKHVMSGVNPQGCQVFSFKTPSVEDLKHDFMWRSTRCLPERGRIGIFNRSYYEEVLVVKVHPEILKSQGIPEELIDEKTIWEDRYRSIVNLEEHLNRNGTKVIKFFLHISKDEQRKRFLKRIEEPEKNWKFSPADIKERELWREYRHAYEECISATSTEAAPWYIIPSDDKQDARLVISQVIVEMMKKLKMSYPTLTPERLAELQAMKKLFEG